MGNPYIEIEQNFPPVVRYDEGRSEMNTQTAIALLKSNGRWMDRFDQMGIPQVLTMLEGKPAFRPMIDLLTEGVDIQDANSVLLSERAKWFAREHGLTFSEAISEVSRLSERAAGFARSRNVTFGEALIDAANKGYRIQDIVKNPDPRQAEEDQAAADVEKGGRWDPQFKQLGQLALQRMRSKGIPFKQALQEVSAEHPELTTLEARIRMNHGVVT